MIIGVVVATFNGEKYICEQLLSIINQTLKPNFIIISDAKSTDETTSLCEKILSKQQDIEFSIIKSNDQLNVTENFNNGLRRCNADYIFMCDQDDVWVENKIEVTIKAMVDHKACLGFTNARIVDSNLKSLSISLWEKIGIICNKEFVVFDPSTGELMDILLRKNIVTGMCTCLSDELLSVALDIPTTTIHDAWLAMVASCNGRVVAINKECVLYRQHMKNQIGVKKTFRKAISNARTYKQKLHDRIDTMQVFMGRYSNAINTEIEYKLRKYEKFLLYRFQYLNGGRKKIKDHKKFYKMFFDENDYRGIIIKDWIYRNILSRVL